MYFNQKRFQNSAFLLFFLLSVTGRANECESVSAYDSKLKSIANVSLEFSKQYAPSLKNDLQPGATDLLATFYNYYEDKQFGSNGQSFNDFLDKNASKFQKIQKSADFMSQSNLDSSRFLTMTQAQSLLNLSTKILNAHVKESIKGSCFVRATHVAIEAGVKYPKIPVIKVWLFGSMKGHRDTSSKWTYHVAPAIPVQADGGIQWMVLDNLLNSSGPLSVKEWVRQTYADRKFASPVSLFFSAVDRIGSSFQTTLSKLQFSKQGGDIASLCWHLVRRNKIYCLLRTR